MSALLCPFAILLIKFSETDLTSHDDQIVAHQQQPTEMVTYLPVRANLSNQVVPESQSECSEPTKFTTFNRHTLKKKMRHKLYHVKFSSSRQQGDGIGMFTAMHYYHTAPVVKFCYHTVSIYSSSSSSSLSSSSSSPSSSFSSSSSSSSSSSYFASYSISSSSLSSCFFFFFFFIIFFFFFFFFIFFFIFFLSSSFSSSSSFSPSSLSSYSTFSSSSTSSFSSSSSSSFPTFMCVMYADIVAHRVMRSMFLRLTVNDVMSAPVVVIEINMSVSDLAAL